MLTIWGRINSINVQKVLWAATEVGVPYERIDAGLAHGVNDTPEYLSLNPNGKIPTLRDGDLVLWESNVIVRYLCARYGDATLCPPDPAERADAERWMDWCTTTLTPLMSPLMYALFRTPQQQRNATAIDTAVEALDHHFGIAERLLADRDFVRGSHFTMADIPLGCFVYRWLALPVSRSDRPVLGRYLARLEKRPAFREHVMLPLS